MRSVTPLVLLVGLAAAGCNETKTTPTGPTKTTGPGAMSNAPTVTIRPPKEPPPVASPDTRG